MITAPQNRRDRAFVEAVVAMMPHWYTAENGPFRHDIELGLSSQTFYTAHEQSPRAAKFLESGRDSLRAVRRTNEERFSMPSEVELFQQRLALAWLRDLDAATKWEKVFAYGESLRYRTYENSPIVRNLIIGDGDGSEDLTDLGQLQKIFDPLMTSQDVFVRVDRDMQFLGYEQVLLNDMKEPVSYDRRPGFLRPITANLLPGEFSFHLTNRGDVIITDIDGLVASWRKGRWYVYDPMSIAGTIVDAFRLTQDNVPIGYHLFDLAVDLSYRRHGALLVFDPEHNVIDNIANPSASLSNSECDPVRMMLASALLDVKVGAAEHLERKKKLFLEVAGLDGAIIFDENNVLAIGAIIRENTGEGNHLGARTTAAYSALKWGGWPIKISSDGEILVLFKSRGPDGVESIGRMEFA